MSTESPEYTEAGARLAGEYLFGGLIAFGVMVFSWLVSADCYFSSRIYNATTAMAVAWIFLYIAVAVTVKSFSSSDDVARKRVAARYVVFVIYALFVVFSLLSLLVFFTSRESVQVTTMNRRHEFCTYVMTNLYGLENPASLSSLMKKLDRLAYGFLVLDGKPRILEEKSGCARSSAATKDVSY